MKLFDYPEAVKVWLYQVVSIIYQIHSNSLFCIGSLMELGIKFPNHMIVEVLVYSSGLSCEKMCSTLQPPTNDAEVNEVSVNFSYNT